MITKEKLKIYDYFNGDAEGLYRVGSPSQKERISHDDWRLIEELVQEVFFIKESLASKEYTERIEAKLQRECENLEVIKTIKSIAEKH